MTHRPWMALPAAALLAATALADERAIADFAGHMARTHGFDAVQLVRTIPAQPNARILAAIEPAATAERGSWQRYRDNFVNAGRIARGVDFAQRHEAVLAQAEARFGVPAEIVVAIIGVETNYGRQTGGFMALEALATLAFHYPPRADFFRRELEAFLLHTREQGIAPQEPRGSYAGATGIPQFMPSSIRQYAVDFDGDGRIDLAGSPADAIGSVAAFLHRHGWQPQGKIARTASFAGEPPSEWLAAGIRPSLPDPAAIAASFPATAAAEDGEKVALLALRTPEAPTEYWWGYHNLYVISRYNRSATYSVAVHLLAEAIGRARAAAPANAPR